MRACPHMPKVLKHLAASALMFLYMCQAPLQMHPLPTLGGSSFKQAQSRKAYHREAFILRRYSITDGHKAAALLFPVRRTTKTLMARNALEPTGPTAPSEVYQERLQPLPVQRHTTKGFAVAPACKSRTQYKRGCLLVQAPNIASVAPFLCIATTIRQLGVTSVAFRLFCDRRVLPPHVEALRIKCLAR